LGDDGVTLTDAVPGTPTFRPGAVAENANGKSYWMPPADAEAWTLVSFAHSTMQTPTSGTPVVEALADTLGPPQQPRNSRVPGGGLYVVTWRHGARRGRARWTTRGGPPCSRAGDSTLRRSRIAVAVTAPPATRPTSATTTPGRRPPATRTEVSGRTWTRTSGPRREELERALEETMRNPPSGTARIACRTCTSPPRRETTVPMADAVGSAATAGAAGMPTPTSSPPQ